MLCILLQIGNFAFVVDRIARRYVDRVPAGRYGEVEELANLAAYMLSDFASFLTGEVSDT